jgi:hypothetical protein
MPLVRQNAKIPAAKLRFDLIDARIDSISILLFARNLGVLFGREKVNTA